MLEEQFG